jgi:hypothetical protein
MMSEYRLTETDATVIRTSDEAYIPNDPANADWVEYQAWLDAGGVPDPYVPPSQPEPEPIPGDVANQRLDTGVNAAVDTYDLFTPVPAQQGQGELSVEERLLRLEKSLKAMCDGHMAYLKEPTLFRK